MDNPLELKSCFTLGVSKDVAKRLLGSHWTMKIWKDEEIWGCYLRCRDMPHLNLWNSFVEGEEKRIEHALLGGFCKVKKALFGGFSK